MSNFTLSYNLFFWSMAAVCGLVSVGIAFFLILFAARYHRRHENELPPQIKGDVRAETLWIGIPFLLFMGMFAYGAKLYFDMRLPPVDALEIYVVGKQWMWKTQHPEGEREINELHIPVGRRVKLTMTSEDVIHSFFIPDFRVKQDVLPNRYTTLWFQATNPGKHHLFCAEYCGTKHSGMIGWVYAMDPHDYEAWLEQGAAEGSMASTGEKLFHQYGCANCHHFDGHGPCPDLQGLYGRTVQISGGTSVPGPTTVVADENYIREKILNPRAKVVQGWKDGYMPSFQGQIDEEQILDLIAYVKALGPAPGSALTSSSGAVPQGSAWQPVIIGPGATSINNTVPDKR
ncbi:MAG TPA: cytochrome c oxidase subunit II [Bryobacteraceae bacterium]|nr:cytochrome c oxidase subunit II [Bryobacteraceae bacterium]